VDASSLTYQWTVQGPAGAPAVTLSDAGSTNADKNDTATVHEAGTYTFTATVTNASGGQIAASTALVILPVVENVSVHAESRFHLGRRGATIHAGCD